MTELKTLKDLHFGEGQLGEDIVHKNDLKAEAVKWVRLMPDEDFKPLQLYNKMQRKAIKDFIRMFFNLTEEDLEEKGK